MSIKIVREDHELGEDRLNQLEAQGLTLISVNYVKGAKLVDDGHGWVDDIKTTTWVYHFRSAAQKLHGDRGRTGTFM
jgi:hypothetical protein